MRAADARTAARTLGTCPEVARVEWRVARRQREEVQVRVDQAGQHGRARSSRSGSRPGRRIGGPLADATDAAPTTATGRRRRRARIAASGPRAFSTDDGDAISPRREAASLP
jgi:hypothetical protein